MTLVSGSQLSVSPDGTSLSLTAPPGHSPSVVTLELYAAVQLPTSGTPGSRVTLKKIKQGDWWPRLTMAKVSDAAAMITCDWDLWVPSDDEDDSAVVSGGAGMDFGGAGMDFGGAGMDFGGAGMDFGGAGMDFGGAGMDFGGMGADGGANDVADADDADDADGGAGVGV
jgi:hypothetical protein